jgi:hypothetical protein
MGRGHFRCTVIGSTERVLAAPFWANLGYEKGDPIFLCIIAFILRSFSRLSKFTLQQNVKMGIVHHVTFAHLLF